MFKKELNFIGDISNLEGYSGELRFEVAYNDLAEDSIECKVLGTQEFFQKSFKALLSEEGFLKVESKSYNHPHISIEKFDLRELPTQYMGSVHELQTIQELNGQAENLELRYEQNSQDEENNFIRFYLTNPHNIWTDMYDLSNLEPNKEVDFKTELDIGLQDFRVFVYLKRPVAQVEFEETKYNVSKSCPVIEFTNDSKTTKSNPKINFERFEKIVRKICLISSVVAQSRIDWFKSEYIIDRYVYHRYKNHDKSNFKKRTSPYLVEHNQIKAFIETGLKAFLDLDSKGLNLSRSIVLYLQSYESILLDDRYALLFLSLENIKSIYAEIHNIEFILNDSLRDDLVIDLRKFIKKNASKYSLKNDSSNRKKIYSNLAGINRNPIRDVLEAMFEEFEISWNDLYPKGSNPSLISNRNNLFHSGIELNYEQLSIDCLRLRILVEKLLLKMLGWNDLSRCPTESIERFIKD